jgi:hypothetical protein
MKAVRKAVNDGLIIQAGGGGSIHPLYLLYIVIIPIYYKIYKTISNLPIYNSIGSGLLDNLVFYNI